MNIIKKKTDVSNKEKLFKCPYCGSQLGQYDVICPACGSEIAQNKDENHFKLVELTLKTKFDDVNRENSELVRGFKTWKTEYKVLYVIANIFFLALPFAIEFLIKQIRLDSLKKFSNDESELASYIRGINVPSSEYYSLLFFKLIKTRMLKERDSFNSKSLAWMKVYYEKAKEVKDSTSKSLNVEKKFKELETIYKEGKKKKTIRVIIASAIVLIILAIITFAVIREEIQ